MEKQRLMQIKIDQILQKQPVPTRNVKEQFSERKQYRSEFF